MTPITNAISAVRNLAGSAGDLSGNADEALYMLEKCGSIQDTILRLEWAESNHRVAGQKIKDALKAVRELTHNAELTGVAKRSRVD